MYGYNTFVKSIVLRMSHILSREKANCVLESEHLKYRNSFLINTLVLNKW